MKRAEVERRIALLRSARDSVNGRPLTVSELDAILPDNGSPSVIGVTIYRRFKELRYRAYLVTPDGKRLLSNPMKSWRDAARKRNQWARQYYQIGRAHV